MQSRVFHPGILCSGSLLFPHAYQSNILYLGQIRIYLCMYTRHPYDLVSLWSNLAPDCFKNLVYLFYIAQCPVNGDPAFCQFWPRPYCSRYYNVIEECPYMCGICKRDSLNNKEVNLPKTNNGTTSKK